MSAPRFVSGYRGCIDLVCSDGRRIEIPKVRPAVPELTEWLVKDAADAEVMAEYLAADRAKWDEWRARKIPTGWDPGEYPLQVITIDADRWHDGVYGAARFADV